MASLIETKDIYDETLEHFFDYNHLKPLQKKVITTIIEDKNDVLAVLATGYGKSICYQLPFLILNKPIIVISPLIALMEDQKISLEEKDIPVICLNSNLSTRLKDYEKAEILKGNYKMIYIAPESVENLKDFIIELYEKHQMPYIAIDESHCISSWGNDFRPHYKTLSCLKEWMPNINIMALTATATQQVRQDIIKSLKLNNCIEITSSFDRPNLYIKCCTKTKDLENDIGDLVRNNKDTFTIVYVRTRELTETISKFINKLGIKCKGYHAGLNPKDRLLIQQQFHDGDFKWIVATVAFGMGIDQNIHLVIHYGSPPDLESYYQEIGRAGRDHEKAECHLYYEKDDMRINRILLKDIENLDYRKNREMQIKMMEKFTSGTICRKKIILEYFGEIKNDCNNCDNCLKELQDTSLMNNQIQYPIYCLLNLLFYIKKKFGITKIINILIGKKDSKIKDFNNIAYYGIGKQYSLDYWKIIFNILIHNDYLEEETIRSGFGTVIKTTRKTLQWYQTIDKTINISNISKIMMYLSTNYITLDIPQIYLEHKHCSNNISGFQELFTDISI